MAPRRYPKLCIPEIQKIHIGPLRTNFSNLDIFAVDDISNVDFLVRRNVIQGVKTKNEVQIAFWIFLIIEDF